MTKTLLKTSSLLPAEKLQRLSELRREASEVIKEAKAPSTRTAYEQHLRQFKSWCDSFERESLPADAETVALFLVEMAGKYKRSTLELKKVAISQAHKMADFPNPVDSAIVRETWKGLCRTQLLSKKRKSRAATTDIVRKMVESLPGDIQGERDRALILLGFAGAFRRSELASLEMKDLRFDPDCLVVSLVRSKTDQEGRGMRKVIHRGEDPNTCPVEALRKWINRSGIKDGAVFRGLQLGGGSGLEREYSTVKGEKISGRTIARVIKRAAERSGLDPTEFSGHSLRSGFATQAAFAGVPEREIQIHTGHRSVETLRGYIQEAEIIDNSASSRLGL